MRILYNRNSPADPTHLAGLTYSPCIPVGFSTGSGWKRCTLRCKRSVLNITLFTPSFCYASKHFTFRKDLEFTSGSSWIYVFSHKQEVVFLRFFCLHQSTLPSGKVWKFTGIFLMNLLFFHTNGKWFSLRFFIMHQSTLPSQKFWRFTGCFF